METVFPFNNNIETGLRMLILLTSGFPKKFDFDQLVYLDYMIVHAGDIDPFKTSLHPDVPNRSGEILVRRNLIQEGLELFISRGLIEQLFDTGGINYRASDFATPFIDALCEKYSLQLIDCAEWIMSTYGNYTVSELQLLLNENLSNLKNEFNLEIVR